MEYALKSLVDYAESDIKAAPDVKIKLRYITRALRTNRDAFGVIPMLATHGSVCNVMKEVGIRAAYGIFQINAMFVVTFSM